MKQKFFFSLGSLCLIVLNIYQLSSQDITGKERPSVHPQDISTKVKSQNPDDQVQGAIEIKPVFLENAATLLPPIRLSEKRQDPVTTTATETGGTAPVQKSVTDMGSEVQDNLKDGITKEQSRLRVFNADGASFKINTRDMEPPAPVIRIPVSNGQTGIRTTNPGTTITLPGSTESAGDGLFRDETAGDGQNLNNVLSSESNDGVMVLKSAMAGVNLIPYQISGRDDKIVLSTVTGTHTSDAMFFETDNIYVDWGALNNGTDDITGTFSIRLYIDGVAKGAWTKTGLGHNTFTFANDFNAGKLTPGAHTFKIVVDSDKQIAETNETDNEYTRSITVWPDINLTPYQPSGWDNKIVVSSATGTHTSTSPLFNNQTLYVDWAVTNNGTKVTSETFLTRLYLDGVLKDTRYTPGLVVGGWAYGADINLGMLTPGSHQIKIETDPTGVVEETNETDNAYTRTITVYPYVNLTTYKPSVFDNKIVLSTVTATNTSDAQIFDTDNIYLDWSVANVASHATTSTFNIDLYIDNVWKAAWARSGLGANTFTNQLDYLVGKLPAGSHTFKIVIDKDGFIPEFNESDNEYSRTITVVNKNLLLYQRSGWDNKLVLSTVSGTSTSASAFYNNQDIYVDWSVWNNGSAAVTETFHSKLYVDGVQKGNWYTSGLAANYTAFVADHNIGKLAIGNHTIRIDVDADGEVAETNEADNSYSRSIYVGPSYNLTPFQPGGWDNKLVLSTVTGTNTSASVIYDTQDIHVDWACINDALNDFTTTFTIRLYIDGVSKGAWTKAGLVHNSYTWAVDANIGKLSAGTHTARLVVDADGQVAESNESDNEYTRTFTVVNKNLLPYQPSGWDNKIVLSTATGTNTSASTICEGQNIYLDYSIHNNGSAAISETFNIRLFIDGVAKATWTRAGLGANTYYTIQDYSLGTLAPGTHTARIVVDVLGNVLETSETDNEYTRTFTVSTCKNLTPYKPDTWDNKLVLSTVPGTNTSATAFYPNQVIYADWAVINDGSNNLTETFTVKLYMDGILKSTWTRAGLTAGVYLYNHDFNAGMLPAGNHTFKIVTDSENNVVESNEGDNEYSRTITVLLPAPVSTAATTITQTSFSANWNAVANAAGYYLDVSASSIFSTFVAGYNNKNVGNVVTSSVTGLTPGITYYYRVRAYNATSTSANSNTIPVATIPPAPVAQAATNITQTSFVANWNSSTGAAGYVIDVATDNAFASMVTGYSNKKLGNVPNYTVTGLNPCTNYYYRVRAYNTSGTSTNSNVITTKTLCVPGAVLSISEVSGNAGSPVCVPVTATGLTDAVTFQFTITYDNTKLTYNNCANWSGGTNAGAVVINSLAGGKLTFSYNNTAVNIANGKFFDICFSINPAATGIAKVMWSDDPVVRKFANSSALTIPCSYNNGGVEITVNAPGAPVATAATGITQTGFTANWNAASGATGYSLDVSTSNTFADFVEGYENKDVGNLLTSAVSGLSGGTVYYYRIRAYNTGGSSGNSNIISATTIINTPPALEATAATSITQTGFTANWDASADATGYYLDVSVSNTFASFVTGYNNKNVGNVLSSEITGLTAGTTYYYRLRAFNAGGTSGNSNTISAATWLSAPAVPVATAATGITQSGFNANWNASPGATGYFLDISSGNTFDDFITDFGNRDVGNVTTFPVSGLDNGTSYYYRLRAYHAGGTSGNSNVITATTLAEKPAAPVAVAATSITTSGFNANWTAVTGANGYFLDVSTGSDFASFVSGFNGKDVGNVVTTPVSGLTTGTAYYFRLRAYNAGGTSGNSNVIDVTTILIAPPAPVATPASGITQTGFNANWNAASGATGYFLDVSTSNTFGSYVPGYNNKDVGNTFTLKVVGLTGGNTYYYRLRAYNDVGTSGNSNTITVTTQINIPAVPVATAATGITQTGLNANWNAAANATGYILDISLTNTFDELLTDYGNRDVGNVTTFSVTGLEPSTNYYYRISAYNAGGTSNYSNTIGATTLVTGIRDLPREDFSVNIYPNPTTGLVKIDLEKSFKETTVSVFNVTGSEILSRQFQSTKEVWIDLSGNTPGVYLIKLNIGKAVVTQKLILNKQD